MFLSVTSAWSFAELWMFVCEIKYKTDLHSSWHFEVAITVFVY